MTPFLMHEFTRINCYNKRNYQSFFNHQKLHMKLSVRRSTIKLHTIMNFSRVAPQDHQRLSELMIQKSRLFSPYHYSKPLFQ
jgi:hypothetical protein